MDNANSFLTDWSIRFLENKDIIRKEIVEIEKNVSGFDFVVHYKDKVEYFIVMPILEGNIFSKLTKGNGFGIIALNNPQNIRFVVSEWKRLINFEFLGIYFINPFSNSDKVWVINPYVHDKICDNSSLESGFKAMSDMVGPLGVEELDNKVKLPIKESGL